MPPRLFACFALLYSGIAISEPHVSTTAVQAEEMAPFWIWWLSLLAVALALHPTLIFLLLRWLSPARPSFAVVFALSAFHLMTGAAAFITMFLVSFAYSRTSPLLFIGFWAALSLLVSSCYVLYVAKWRA